MAKKTIQPDRAGTRSVRRIAHDFIQKGERRLGRPQLSDQDVHQARKNLQKSRAALRLLRVALGEGTYKRDNTALRDAARSLNAVRDARVLAQTLTRVSARGPGLKDEAALTELAQVLQTEQAQAQREMLQSEALAGPRDALQHIGRKAHRWHVAKAGWSDLGPGFKRIYRTARRAMPPADPPPSEAALHEWRKRSKYLRYALQMLAPIRPQAMTVLINRARTLSDCLGEHHDLSLLALKAQDFARGNHHNVAALLAAIEQRQARLTARALIVGAQLYEARTAALGRQLEGYWHGWRRQRRAAA